ncbi:hypothetical protein [Jannaschia sp. R86511]|uniref:hypothetical protein n=1 Tax=Jannaschia sp. R86511 TaxID=3093853 RepID=UPI0036D3B45E
MSEAVQQSTDTAVKAAVVMSAAALVLSGVTFVLSLDDSEREREVDARLTCLEIPGPNDCGIDD